MLGPQGGAAFNRFVLTEFSCPLFYLVYLAYIHLHSGFMLGKTYTPYNMHSNISTTRLKGKNGKKLLFIWLAHLSLLEITCLNYNKLIFSFLFVHRNSTCCADTKIESEKTKCLMQLLTKASIISRTLRKREYHTWQPLQDITIISLYLVCSG